MPTPISHGDQTGNFKDLSGSLPIMWTFSLLKSFLIYPDNRSVLKLWSGFKYNFADACEQKKWRALRVRESIHCPVREGNSRPTLLGKFDGHFTTKWFYLTGTSLFIAGGTCYDYIHVERSKYSSAAIPTTQMISQFTKLMALCCREATLFSCSLTMDEHLVDVDVWSDWCVPPQSISLCVPMHKGK